jgi:uncharacterized protein YuzE
MAEIEIDEILKALKAIKHSHVKDMHVRYDQEVDTMYVNFGAPIPADDSELGDNDILYRYRDGEIIGITVTHFTKR